MKYAWLAIPLIATAAAANEPSAERGHKALITRNFVPPTWSIASYENLWKQWGDDRKEPPRDYDRAVRAHYGLHATPFDNGRLPMGLRAAKGILGSKGIATDCMLCHGGSIMGKSYIGLGNSTLDIDALFSDLNAGSGLPRKLPFTFCNVRGTCEAAGFAVYLLSYREPDLKLRYPRRQFELRDWICEDTPAWWLLKKKKTMYITGSNDARSVRSIMQFMLNPLNARGTFEKAEATFADIRAYLLTLEPPRYPLPIDEAKAARGARVFVEHCARCHGKYGKDWTYPNRIVPIKTVGTDPERLEGVPRAVGEFYNQSWFAQEAGGYTAKEAKGYQAPPLDGVWATAPYFHNGSVPTLYDVLNSKTRPKLFTRSYQTGTDDYDAVKVGWKVRVLDRVPDGLSPLERRKIYDTTQRGRSNAGHTFGDDLTDAERWAVVEYLKKL